MRKSLSKEAGIKYVAYLGWFSVNKRNKFNLTPRIFSFDGTGDH